MAALLTPNRLALVDPDLDAALCTEIKHGADRRRRWVDAAAAARTCGRLVGFSLRRHAGDEVQSEWPVAALKG